MKKMSILDEPELVYENNHAKFYINCFCQSFKERFERAGLGEFFQVLLAEDRETETKTYLLQEWEENDNMWYGIDSHNEMEAMAFKVDFIIWTDKRSSEQKWPEEDSG